MYFMEGHVDRGRPVYHTDIGRSFRAACTYVMIDYNTVEYIYLHHGFDKVHTCT